MLSSCLRPIAASLLAFGLSACAEVWAPASAGGADDVVAIKAYPGPLLGASEVAALYAFDGDNNGSAQWICEVDGHDLQRTIRLSQRCANVVYLTPGEHVILWRYHSFMYRVGYRGHGDTVGSGRLRIDVAAGSSYQLVVDGFQHTANVWSIQPPPDQLSYVLINPTFERKLMPLAKAEPLKDTK